MIDTLEVFEYVLSHQSDELLRFLKEDEHAEAFVALAANVPLVFYDSTIVRDAASSVLNIRLLDREQEEKERTSANVSVPPPPVADAFAVLPLADDPTSEQLTKPISEREGFQEMKSPQFRSCEDADDPDFSVKFYYYNTLQSYPPWAGLTDETRRLVRKAYMAKRSD